jgi:predicted ATP-grasp superfamily ATP-dependent carboligase
MDVAVAASPLRVLITDGDARSALAATRTIGLHGHTVFVASHRAPSLAGSSRHCSRSLKVPDGNEDPESFIDTIVAACVDYDIDVLLPMAEVSTLLVTAHRGRLPPNCSLPFAPSATIAQASDKAFVAQLATSLGMHVPATIVVAEMADIAGAVANHRSYPVVIKPARSRVPTADGYLSTGVSYANTADELNERLASLHPLMFPVLLQERIVGPGVGIFVCYSGGRRIATFAHKRLREKPPSGGVSVLRESIATDPVALEHTDRLMGALHWDGVAMVEFKRNEATHTLALMEINARFWGSLQLAIDSGVDFPMLLLRLASGENVATQTTYRTGVKSRWFWGDVDALLTILFSRRSQLNLPPGYPGRFRSLLNFLKFWDSSVRDEIFRMNDLKPWLLETRRWVIGR